MLLASSSNVEKSGSSLSGESQNGAEKTGQKAGVESTEASNVGSKQSGLTNGQNAVNETRSESPEVTKKSPEDEHLSSKDSHDIQPGMSPLAETISVYSAKLFPLIQRHYFR